MRLHLFAGGLAASLLLSPSLPPSAQGREKPAGLPPSATLDRSKIPDGGPPPALTLPKPARFTLSSGPKVLVVERHSLPMAAIAVVWPAGVADEPVDAAGVASLAADLLDEGTQKRGALELADALEALGTNLDAGASWDSTAVSLVTITRNLDASLALLAEVVSAPAFDEKEFERVRNERLTGFLQRKDAASLLASDMFSKVLYGEKTRYGEPVVGTEAALKKLTPGDVASWYRGHLRPHAATIIVAGDLTAAEARAKLEKAFAGWKEPEGAAHDATASNAKPEAPEAPPPAARRVIVDKPNAPQTELRMGEPSVPRRSPDYFPLTVMNEILGGGDFSNRLNLNLREQHAYTYGAHSGIAFRRQGGPFVVATAVKTQVTGPSVMEAYSEVLRIRSAPVDARELRLAKDALERAMARRFETDNDLVGELAAQVMYELPDDYFATFSKKVEAVTVEEVKRVATQHLDPAKLSVVLVGDRGVITPQLKDLPIGAFEVQEAGATPAGGKK